MAHSRTLKKERMLHEPQKERLIKQELMAKAGICLEIVFTSLKAGADFKNRQKYCIKTVTLLYPLPRFLNRGL